MDKPYNIQQRSFRFSMAVTLFCRRLGAAHPVTRRMGWQLLDSSTSIGANMEEANAAQSKRDFISKTAIARKEARETVYWLKLIAATDAECRTAANGLLQEANEISAIVAAINRNASKRSERRRKKPQQDS